MADATATETTATTEDTATAATPEAKGGDAGEAFRLRQELKAAKAKAKEAETLAARLKEIEDAKLSETEKLQRRVSELEPYQARVAEYESTLQGVYEVEVEEITEGQREKIARLIPEGLPLAMRLSMLKNLKAEGVFRTPEEAATAPSRPAPRIDNTRPTNGQPAGTVLKASDIARMSPEEYRKHRADILGGRIKVVR